jgi:ribonuclease-3
MIDKEKLQDFQEFIDYWFKKESLLIEALTTPQLANEIGIPSYDFLETLGDAVIKIIFILRLHRKGVKDSGEVTKMKAALESDNALKKVANKIELERYILKTKKQRIKGTHILADIFEALCGALFLDSNYNLDLIEQKMITPFYNDLESIIQNSIISDKNALLEFLQERFKTNIFIELEYEKNGEEHDPIWVAKNPRILDKNNQKELVKIPTSLKSAKLNSKKGVEKDLYAKILRYLERKNQYGEKG